MRNRRSKLSDFLRNNMDADAPYTHKTIEWIQLLVSEGMELMQQVNKFSSCSRFNAILLNISDQV